MIMYEFTSTVDIDIIGSHNVQSGGGTTKVKWTLELEMRKYGVQSFIIVVPEQVVTSDVWRYNEETDEEYQEEVSITIKDVKVDVSSCSMMQGLYPTKLEIYQGKATLEFV